MSSTFEEMTAYINSNKVTIVYDGGGYRIGGSNELETVELTLDGWKEVVRIMEINRVEEEVTP